MSTPDDSPDALGSSAEPASKKLAIALSGGGSRAIAFHLGCLKALESSGLLGTVAAISCVSGGSVLGALYCSHPGDFASFEKRVRQLLREGLNWHSLRIAVTTTEGLKAAVAAVVLGIDRFLATGLRTLLRIGYVGVPQEASWLTQSPIRRWASRTTILRRALDEIFEGRTLLNLRPDRPKLIIVACELQAKSAFYFAADGAGAWRYGTASGARLKISHAVAASASYPAALPALDEAMTFERDGMSTRRRVVLTDGGVYDNLGLSPLWPGRAKEISLHVDEYPRIIACRAGYALEQAAAPAFWPSRMVAAMESIFARSQNFATTRLFDLKAAGSIEDFLLPYLGQDDRRLKFAPADLVRRETVAGYPTNFDAMSEVWIDRLVRRGEQLTLALCKEYDWLKESSPCQS